MRVGSWSWKQEAKPAAPWSALVLAWHHLALCRSALASAGLSPPFSFSFFVLFLKFSWILKAPHNIKDIVEIRGSPAIIGH